MKNKIVPQTLFRFRRGLLKHFAINLTSAVVTPHSMTSLRKTPFRTESHASLNPSATEALSR
jgi:hypothetical protein